MIKKDCSILVVDNDPVSGSLLAQQISGIPGMSVSACLTDGNRAVEHLWTHPVDILITEVDLPGMDGLALIDYCHRQNHKLGCIAIIVSAVRDFDIAIQALQLGVLNYLPKPLHFPQLAEVLEIARSRVHLSRLYIQVNTRSPYHDLEQAICASFRTGASPELWSEQVKELLTAPGQLLRISHQTPISETRDFAFLVYWHILRSLVPSHTTLLCLYPEETSVLYLMILPQDRPHRTVESLRKWFDHIIEHKVTLTVEGTIESVDQLISLASKTKDHNKAIEDACVYIQCHLSETLTREAVANQVFLSPSYFAQLFKQVMGVCLRDYVTDARIAHAKASLAQNISIREVAAAAGFRNMKHFREIFYKKTGYMPSDYRRALLTGTIKPKE